MQCNIPFIRIFSSVQVTVSDNCFLYLPQHKCFCHLFINPNYKKNLQTYFNREQKISNSLTTCSKKEKTTWFASEKRKLDYKSHFFIRPSIIPNVAVFTRWITTVASVLKFLCFSTLNIAHKLRDWGLKTWLKTYSLTRTLLMHIFMGFPLCAFVPFLLNNKKVSVFEHLFL